MNSDKARPVEGQLTVAEKLEHLLKLRARLSEDGVPSYKTLAAEIAAQSGESFSGAYLWQLHRGERTNPTLRHLRALAAYFGVPVSYFMDDDVARRMMEEDHLASRELDQSMAEAGVSAVYLRGDLAALSPEGKRMAADMIRQIRELEQNVNKPPSAPQT
ncbi:helix-turn-helix domain-containing protein [Streptomyces sp. WAC05858]|uniref:helix-turn-helix domain-containing protein n=1 Tax=Streptomyces TaxID=1883 RepID=UPI000F776061|nr:helix-turn-helix domain-containing protein [Streptomyces sp. WAC05858]RSS35455.1 XRE family transcriptional regulator [Streptomyces sp. WAC05858]WTB04008.1 helix-turn-helix domain-containing protein [Streptomyces antimycoticus]